MYIFMSINLENILSQCELNPGPPAHETSAVVQCTAVYSMVIKDCKGLR